MFLLHINLYKYNITTSIALNIHMFYLCVYYTCVFNSLLSALKVPTHWTHQAQGGISAAIHCVCRETLLSLGAERPHWPTGSQSTSNSPTDSMQKSKLSSDASFLLDFSLPCRLTIFKFSAKRERQKKCVKSDWLSKTCKVLLLTVQTHQHRVPFQLGDVNCINLLISWREITTVTTCVRVTGTQDCSDSQTLTRSHLGEPGGAGVEVDGLETCHLAGLWALADGHAHQRVLLLWHHQHLKHLQGAGQREIKVLQQQEDQSQPPATVQC